MCLKLCVLTSYVFYVRLVCVCMCILTRRAFPCHVSSSSSIQGPGSTPEPSEDGSSPAVQKERLLHQCPGVYEGCLHVSMLWAFICSYPGIPDCGLCSLLFDIKTMFAHVTQNRFPVWLRACALSKISDNDVLDKASLSLLIIAHDCMKALQNSSLHGSGVCSVPRDSMDDSASHPPEGALFCMLVLFQAYT